MDTSILNRVHALRAMTVGELQVEWERLYGQPTRSRNREHLWRRLAWRLQELALGGLSESVKSTIADLAPVTFTRARTPASFDPTAPPKTRRDPRLPRPGSTLTRSWHGQEIRVLLLDDGFEWN